MHDSRSPRSNRTSLFSLRSFPASMAFAGAMALLSTGVQSAGSLPQAPRRSDFTWVGTVSQGVDVLTGFERAKALAFDSEGNVLAAGQTATPPGALGTTFFTVAKWSPTGVRQWVRHLSEAELTQSEALSVATGPDDSVVAGGHLVEVGGNQQFTVAKWSADGQSQWVKKFDRSSTSPEQARLVAVDSSGDVIAVGSSFSEDTVWDVAIYKLRGSDGEVLWSRHIDGTTRSYDMPQALVLDEAGDLFIGGEIGNETESACAVMKVRGSDGERLWTNSLDRPNAFGGGEKVNSVALTSTGDVVACGTAYGGETGDDFMVGRFDGETGMREWQYFTDSALDFNSDEGLSVAVDSRDDVLAAGNSQDFAENHGLLVKLNGSSGLEQWRRRIPLPAVNPDFSSAAALAVAVDDRDHAFLLCQKFGFADFLDTVVAEWDTRGRFESLRQLPEPAERTDELAEVLAVDHRGNLAVGGEIGNDFAVAYRASRRVERLSVQPGSLAFGSVKVGEERTRPLQLRNTGTAPLIGRITSEAPQFQLSTLGGPVAAIDFRIPAGKSLRFFVQFTPGAAGRRSGELSVTSSDPRRPIVQIRVSGTGRPAQ